MRREQMEAWIEDVVANTATPKQAAKKIADRWEFDVKSAREDGVAIGGYAEWSRTNT